MSDKTEDQIREGLKLLAEDVQSPEGEVGRRAHAWRLPGITPRLAAALAGAVICAALVTLSAAGTFDGGRSYGDIAVGTVGGAVTVERSSDGTLNLVHVRLRAFPANPDIQLEVVHSTPTGGQDVVYTTQISMNPVTWLCATDSTGAIGPTGEHSPIGWTGPHGPIHECHAAYKWAGTLAPSDWRGGCQSTGEYSVVAAGVPIYRSFACVASDPGAVGPSGQEGPAG